MKDPCRSAAWLTGDRARDWLRPFALAMFGTVAAAALVLAVASLGKKPPSLDFVAFWVAGRFVLAGHPALAYDNAAVELAERAATIMPPGCLAFYYPPPFLLLCAPFGVFGYVLAFGAFVAAGAALLVACLRRIVPRDWGWLPLIAFPGLLMNGLSGQAGALCAACFGGAAIWLDTRPVLAGFCLSGLVCKPQLALCIPIALLAARRLRALCACGTGALALAALSWCALGTGAWRGFLAHGSEASGNIVHIAIIWPKLQSVFGAVRLEGGSVPSAAAAQAVVSLGVVIWLARLAARQCGACLEMAALATASLLFTPYLLDYDLVILAVPIACMARLAQRDAWRPYEKIVLLLLYLLPLAARASGMLLGLTLGPPLMLLLMLLIWSRATASASYPQRKRVTA
jgi:hypothetical protein